MSATKQYTCEKPACRKIFTAKKADRRRGWARFCSKSCAAWVREKKMDRQGYRLSPREQRRREEDRDLVFAGHDDHFDKYGVCDANGVLK